MLFNAPVRGLALAACAALLVTIASSTPSAATADTSDGDAQPAQRPVAKQASGRLYASVTKHVYAGDRVRVRGKLRPARGGRLVRLQLRTRRGWQTVDRGRTRRHGRFRVAWRPSSVGRYRFRVRFGGSATISAARDRLARVHVYRAGHASWYGPGLYGNPTACGGALTPSRLGVAHRWLPCGTRVTFRYRGRSVTVPVIDRGPFAAGRDWDLTAATKAKLRFGDIGVVWSTR